MRSVNFATLVNCCLIVVLLTATWCPDTATADIFRGYYTIFGEILTAREAAMGDCASTNVGPDALFYNPGAYGVYFLDHDFEVAAPIPQKRLPERYTDFRVFALNAGVRFDKALFGQSNAEGRNWSLAIGVSHIRATLPTYYPWYWDLRPYDRDNLYSTGITLTAAHNGRLRVGAGATLKFLNADLNYYGAAAVMPSANKKAVVIDAGFYADFDLLASRSASHNRNWSIVPAVAIVFANSGRAEFAYFDPFFADPVPHLIRYASSLKLTRWHEGRERTSLRGVYERDNWTGEYYEDKIGGEVGLANALFVRAGKVFTKYDNERKPVTWGIGVSLRGLLSSTRQPVEKSEEGKRSFWRRGDVKFDYGHYKDEKDEYEANTNFFRVTFTVDRP